MDCSIIIINHLQISLLYYSHLNRYLNDLHKKILKIVCWLSTKLSIYKKEEKRLNFN